MNPVPPRTRRLSGARASRGDNAPTAKLWDLLSAAGADVVLSGHEHIYENFAPRDRDGAPAAGGMREFVVGTGGAGGGSARTAANFHYGVIKLTLGTGSYAWEFLPVAGDSLSDRGSASCNNKRAAQNRAIDVRQVINISAGS